MRNKLLLVLFVLVVVLQYAYQTLAQEIESEKEQTSEDIAWAAVNCLNKDSAEAFLAQFPNGKFVEEAKLAVALQDALSDVRSGITQPLLVIQFDTLGEVWPIWEENYSKGFSENGQGIIGYNASKSVSDNTYVLSWYRLMSGGLTPGCNSIIFDGGWTCPSANPPPGGIVTVLNNMHFNVAAEITSFPLILYNWESMDKPIEKLQKYFYQGCVTPTGDGSIIAFRTNGLWLVYLGHILFKTPTDCSLYFGVVEGKGLVYLMGTGEVVLPDGQIIKLEKFQPFTNI